MLSSCHCIAICQHDGEKKTGNPAFELHYSMHKWHTIAQDKRKNTVMFFAEDIWVRRMHAENRTDTQRRLCRPCGNSAIRQPGFSRSVLRCRSVTPFAGRNVNNPIYFLSVFFSLSLLRYFSFSLVFFWAQIRI